MFLVVAIVFVASNALSDGQQSYGFGRAPTDDELANADLDVRFDGDGLPPGRGTADEGKKIFLAKCSVCHGASLEGNKTLRVKPLISNARHSISMRPYAPPLFGYIRRSMPLNKPGSLTNGEVYGLVAYLLQKAGVEIGSSLDAQALSAVEMPNRRNFIPAESSGVLDSAVR